MFNQRKNKRFTYKPRFQNSDASNSREESESQMEAQWNALRRNTKRKGNIFTSLPFLIIFLAALFVLIYILNGYIK